MTVKLAISSSVNVIVTIWSNRASKSLSELISLIATVIFSVVPSITLSFTPLTVTVCEVFQLVGVKINCVTLVVVSLVLLEIISITTLVTGCRFSTTSNVSTPPSSSIVKLVSETVNPTVSSSFIVYVCVSIVPRVKSPVGLSMLKTTVSAGSNKLSSVIANVGIAIAVPTVPSYTPAGIVTTCILVKVKSLPTVAVVLVFNSTLIVDGLVTSPVIKITGRLPPLASASLAVAKLNSTVTESSLVIVYVVKLVVPITNCPVGKLISKSIVSLSSTSFSSKIAKVGIAIPVAAVPSYVPAGIFIICGFVNEKSVPKTASPPETLTLIVEATVVVPSINKTGKFPPIASLSLLAVLNSISTSLLVIATLTICVTTASKSLSELLAFTATLILAASSPKTVSSTAVTVIVCGVFQFPFVNVTCVRFVLTSVKPLDIKSTTTSVTGCAVNAIVNVPVVPSINDKLDGVTVIFGVSSFANVTATV